MKPLAIPLEFEHFGIIAKVNKSTDHGKMISICYWRLGRIKINFNGVHIGSDYFDENFWIQPWANI